MSKLSSTQSNRKIIENLQSRSLSTQKDLDIRNNNYNEIKEKLWNPYFQAMCSKDNSQVHLYKREFFDKPFYYNPSGIRLYILSSPLLNFAYQRINKGLNLTMDNSYQISQKEISNSGGRPLNNKSNSSVFGRNLPQISLYNEKKKEMTILPIKVLFYFRIMLFKFLSSGQT